MHRKGNPTLLVPERFLSGNFGWLPSTDRAEADDALYTITDFGREYLARRRFELWLFGRQVCP